MASASHHDDFKEAKGKAVVNLIQDELDKRDWCQKHLLCGASQGFEFCTMGFLRGYLWPGPT